MPDDAVRPETVELMYLSIDGEATTEEQAQLTAALNSSSATRMVYEETRSFCRDLDALPSQEPPRDLVASVMAGLQARPAAAPRDVASAGTAAWRPRRKLLVAAWAAAAAAIVALAVLTPALLRMDDRPISRAQAEGSMAVQELMTWPVVATVSSNVGEDIVTVRSAGDRYWVLPRVSDPQQTVRVQWNREKLILITVKGEPMPARDRGEIVLAGRDVRDGIILERRPSARGRTEIRIEPAGARSATASIELR